MQTTSFAQRARTYVRPQTGNSSISVDEINEINEIIPLPVRADPPEVMRPEVVAFPEFVPIDRVIARDLARQHTVEQIQARIDDSRRQAEAYPDWAPIAAAIGDWTAILAVKLAPARLDDVPDDMPEPEEEAR